MSKKIEMKATVEKVMRMNGKAQAQVVITIPESSTQDFPLGAVMLTVQPLQSALFDKTVPIRGAKAPKNTL